MNKKKVIKIVTIIFVAIILLLLFLFRVTILNSIDRAKVKSAVKDSFEKPDYQIQFLNNVENHADGSGYRHSSDVLLVFLDEKKIIYSNEGNFEDKVAFTIGDSHYLKIKIKELDDNLIEIIKKYEQNKYLLTPEKSLKRTKANNGEIELFNIKYDSANNFQEAKQYFIPKSDNTELYKILEQVKN